MKDKISKIDKLENSHKAQAIIKEAQSASVATKSANPQKKKPAKASAKSGQKSLTLGVITISTDTKKLAKIETFFAKFIKNTKDKNEFIEAAIMRHIKKCKKKFKKN